MDKHDKRVIHSGGKDDWETPHEFFNKLDACFKFTLDPCAEASTAKCVKYYTKEENGLDKSWRGETVFVNPPYSKSDEWLAKCYQESLQPNTVVVALVAARTDTKRWARYAMKADQIHFIKGRLKFLDAGNERDGAPFPSALLVFRTGVGLSNRIYGPRVYTLEK